MLEGRVGNFNDSPILSSMRDSKEGLKFISSLALKLMLMVEFRACNNNQCPIDWFKMQVETTCFK
jgi:hypothetical protein